VKIFKELLENEDENRNMESIPPSELQELSIKFVLGVRKKGGEEYESLYTLYTCFSKS